MMMVRVTARRGRCAFYVKKIEHPAFPHYWSRDKCLSLLVSSNVSLFFKPLFVLSKYIPYLFQLHQQLNQRLYTTSGLYYLKHDVGVLKTEDL